MRNHVRNLNTNNYNWHKEYIASFAVILTITGYTLLCETRNKSLAKYMKI